MFRLKEIGLDRQECAPAVPSARTSNMCCREKNQHVTTIASIRQDPRTFTKGEGEGSKGGLRSPFALKV